MDLIHTLLRKIRNLVEKLPELKIRTGPLQRELSWDSILRMKSMASWTGLVSSSRYFTNMS